MLCDVGAAHDLLKKIYVIMAFPSWYSCSHLGVIHVTWEAYFTAGKLPADNSKVNAGQSSTVTPLNPLVSNHVHLRSCFRELWEHVFFSLQTFFHVLQLVLKLKYKTGERLRTPMARLYVKSLTLHTCCEDTILMVTSQH